MGTGSPARWAAGATGSRTSSTARRCRRRRAFLRWPSQGLRRCVSGSATMAESDAVTPYAGYDVLAKWSSLSFDDTTRAVLRRRLETSPERRFFSASELRVLEAACARLLATAPGDPPIANAIDGDLFAGRSEGFRAPEAPRLAAAWHTGLA